MAPNGWPPPAQQVRQFGVAHVQREVLAVPGARVSLWGEDSSAFPGTQGGRVEPEVPGELSDAVRRLSAGRGIRGGGSQRRDRRFDGS